MILLKSCGAWHLLPWTPLLHNTAGHSSGLETLPHPSLLRQTWRWAWGMCSSGLQR